ncbi:MAG TPA: response regulator, partial [Gemmatimonadales bacterium]|nr:response regulator [Gemmatimonadales bacterium]
MVRTVEAPLRARTLLVIDDEPPIRRAVANALREVADRVLEASTGGEGTDLAAAERPELVVLDLGLPD